MSFQQILVACALPAAFFQQPHREAHCTHTRLTTTNAWCTEDAGRDLQRLDEPPEDGLPFLCREAAEDGSRFFQRFHLSKINKSYGRTQVRVFDFKSSFCWTQFFATKQRRDDE
jgi:hypothetical protein